MPVNVKSSWVRTNVEVSGWSDSPFGETPFGAYAKGYGLASVGWVKQ